MSSYHRAPCCSARVLVQMVKRERTQDISSGGAVGSPNTTWSPRCPCAALTLHSSSEPPPSSFPAPPWWYCDFEGVAGLDPSDHADRPLGGHGQQDPPQGHQVLQQGDGGPAGTAPYACTYLDRSVRSLEKSGSLKTPVFKFVQVSPKSSHDDGKTRACADTFRTCTCTCTSAYCPPVCYTDKSSSNWQRVESPLCTGGPLNSWKSARAAALCSCIPARP